jgi:two-component sensor histidine kinase
MTSDERRVKSSLVINLSAVIVIWVMLSMAGALLFLVWIVQNAAEKQVELQGAVIGSVATAAVIDPLLVNDFPTIQSRLQSLVDTLPDVVFCQLDSSMPTSVGAEVSVGERDALTKWIRGEVEGFVVFLAPVEIYDPGPIQLAEIAVGFSRERIDASTREQITWVSIGLGLSFLFVSVSLVYVLQRVIGRPLSVLGQQASELASGNLDAPIRLDSQTEFGHLAQTLEGMRIRVSEQIQSLQSLSEELTRSSDSQRILFRELDHRVRNNLAGLASLISLSQQNSTGIDDFAESIRGRVHAMSVVHSMLSQEHWDPIDLASMISLLIPPGAKGTLEMEQNPNVLVPSPQATACGMVFQELMANSLKYGAWSNGGVVHVIWSPPEVEDDGARRLAIHWRETGGPVIEKEVSPGTGTGLIEGFVTHELRGSLELRYEPEGVRHDLVFRFKMDRGQLA